MGRPVFGEDRDPAVAVLWTGGRLPPKGAPKFNPMIRALGAGPDGARCGECVHFLRANIDTARMGYTKCELRGITRGPGTDHRAKWDACARYEARP